MVTSEPSLDIYTVQISIITNEKNLAIPTVYNLNFIAHYVVNLTVPKWPISRPNNSKVADFLSEWTKKNLCSKLAEFLNIGRIWPKCHAFWPNSVFFF